MLIGLLVLLGVLTFFLISVMTFGVVTPFIITSIQEYTSWDEEVVVMVFTASMVVLLVMAGAAYKTHTICGSVFWCSDTKTEHKEEYN